MVDESWGQKHICGQCQLRFYDLGRHPLHCPKCGIRIETGDGLFRRAHTPGLIHAVVGDALEAEATPVAGALAGVAADAGPTEADPAGSAAAGAKPDDSAADGIDSEDDFDIEDDKDDDGDEEEDSDGDVDADPEVVEDPDALGVAGIDGEDGEDEELDEVAEEVGTPLTPEESLTDG